MPQLQTSRASAVFAGVALVASLFALRAPALAQTAPTASPAPQQLTPAQQATIQQFIIKTTQNPVGNVSIIPFQNNFNFGVGPYARYQYNLNLQPVVPAMLSPNLNLVVRVIMPIVNQPSAAPPQVCASFSGCNATFGIGDFNPQFYFAPKTKPGALIWGIGPQFLVPAASPGTLGSGKWSAGPTAVALVMPGAWVIGTLVNQLWSFAGPSSRANVSTFLVQPFVNYNFRGGLALSFAPAITANWTAPQNKWTVPIGLTVVKTFKAGEQVMQLALGYFTYVARPVNAPQTQLRIQWSLVFPIKRISREDLIKEALSQR